MTVPVSSKTPIVPTRSRGNLTARVVQTPHAFSVPARRKVYWARTRVGQLENAMPALRDMLAGREFVIMESNSILRFLRPDVYLPLLRFDVDDFKLSSRIYLQRADAYVVVASAASQPAWPGIPPGLLDEKPVFRVDPPSYCGPDVLQFVWERLGVPTARTARSQ